MLTGVDGGYGWPVLGAAGMLGSQPAWALDGAHFTGVGSKTISNALLNMMCPHPEHVLRTYMKKHEHEHAHIHEP